MKVFTATFGMKRGEQDVPSSFVLQREGPVLEVEVAVSSSLARYLAEKKLPIPEPVKGMALIDSGATGSAVDREVIGQLGVKPMGERTVFTAGGPDRQNRYAARFIFLRPKMSFEFSSVIGANLKGQSVVGRDLIVLLGRDVLSRCIFIYNGVNASYTLAV